MESPSLTEALVDWVMAKPITDHDRDIARLFVLDAVACAIGAKTTPQGEIFRDWYAHSGTDAGRQAMAFGAMVHTLEIDDLHRASVVHLGCVVIPAAWAVARRENASGTAMLDAVVRGFEVACRIGMAVGPAHYEIWHNTATCGPFGAAMATACLLNLSAEKSVDALGSAGTQSSGLWEFLSAGAMSKHLHAGRAAEAGITAADLASLGLTGPKTILEGKQGFFAATCPDPQPSAINTGIDQPWQVHQTSIKPWPSCRHTHPTIDAALELGSRYDLDDIEDIDVSTYQAAINVCNRPLPQTDYDAKFSLQHCVVAALSSPQVDFHSFNDSAREALSGYWNRVRLSADASFDVAYPDRWGAEIRLTLKNGDTAVASRHFAKGDPEAALTPAEMMEKAAGLMSMGALNDNRGLIDSIMSLGLAPIPALPLPGLS